MRHMSAHCCHVQSTPSGASLFLIMPMALPWYAPVRPSICSEREAHVLLPSAEHGEAVAARVVTGWVVAAAVVVAATMVVVAAVVVGAGVADGVQAPEQTP